MNSMKLIAAAALSAVCALSASSAFSADTSSAMPLIDRAAKGDITAPGGARRLSADQTEMLRAS